MLNSSIWPIDRTLSTATTPGLSESGSDGNEEVLKESALPEPHYQNNFSHKQDTRWGGGLILLLKCSRCIL